VCGKKIDGEENYTLIAGHFYGHAYAKVRCDAHCPMERIQGFTHCHWMQPSDKYTCRIAPAAAMVIEFGVKKNTNKTLLLASRRTVRIVFFNFGTRKEPPIHVINATSFI
jgi:hypothetical protein